jgi:POT family proton-dependent oligopeptide transporter
MPRQIPYIIANEGCERFSFYGMRNILTPFLLSTLLLFIPVGDRTEAKHVFHTFVIGVYFFPLLGGWIADRFWGKYKTVFWFSLIYVAGHACLAIFEHNLEGFYLGLALIAFGSGGIKPLVVAFVGDQFDQTNKNRAKVVFDAFYWIINFGSFFASLLMPVFLRDYGPAVAFGIPGILMAIATLVFWAGRKKYARAAGGAESRFVQQRGAHCPAGARNGQSRPGLMVAGAGAVAAVISLCMTPAWGFVIAACTALVLVLAFGGIGVSMQLERARGIHTDEAVEGVRAVLRILIVFAMITPFWSLFDQKASTWIVQANSDGQPAAVDLRLGIQTAAGADAGGESDPGDAADPVQQPGPVPADAPGRHHADAAAPHGPGHRAVGIVVGGDRHDPAVDGWRRQGLHPVAAAAVCAADLGEVLVSATGLEFAYSQAPASMKGIILSFWYLAVTVGNLWVLIVNAGVKNDVVGGWIASSGLSPIAFQMFFFAAFAAAVAALFALYALRYKMVDNYRKAA